MRKELSGYQRYVLGLGEDKPRQMPAGIYKMESGWYTVRLPDKWVGVFFTLERAMQAKSRAEKNV